MASQKKKICFIIPSLDSGGAERVISIISSNLNKEHYDVHLVVLTGSVINYSVEVQTLHQFQSSRVLFSMPKLVHLLRSIKPDYLFTTLTYLNVLVALFSPLFNSVKIIARESTIPSLNNKRSQLAKVYDLLVKVLYKKFSIVVAQSADMANDLVNTFRIKKEKIVIINNPIDSKANPFFKRDYKNEIPIFITVAMFRPEKGILRLLGILAQYHVPFEYWIIGEGDERSKIEGFLQSYPDLAAKVKLMGYQKNIPELLSKADLYFQGSYYEGFPNILLEAGLQGIPVVALACIGGTKEIIQEDVNGLMVSKDDQFLEKVKIAMEKQWDQTMIRNSVLNRFDVSVIMQQYEKLLIQLS